MGRLQNSTTKNTQVNELGIEINDLENMNKHNKHELNLSLIQKINRLDYVLQCIYNEN